MRDAILQSSWGAVALGLAVGSLVLMAALTAFARPRTAWMRSRIAVYAGDDAATVDHGFRPRIDQLFALTERKLDRTTSWGRLERLVERSATSLRPVEVVYVSLAAGVALGTLAAVLGLSAFLVFLVVAAGICMLPALLAHRGRQRRRRFDEQLPDTLLSIASSLKVGHSFDNAVQAVVATGQSPTSEEFEHLLADTHLGRTMDDALAGMADRVGSHELALVLMTVRIQRQVGGTLASLFETVAHVVQERRHFHAKVRALTATGRLTAYVLTALPVLTGLLVTVISPGYLSPLFHTTGGRIALIWSAVGLVLGGWLLKRIVTVKG